MFGRLARAVTVRPWFVVVGWVVAAAVILVLAPRLSEVTNADQAAFLPAGAESARAAELAQRAFPGAQGATAVIVVDRVDGAALTPADADRVGQLAQRLNQVSSSAVAGVLFDKDQSISANGLVGTLGVALTAAPEDESVRAAVGALRAEAAEALAGSGLEAGMTGQAAIVVDNKAAFADAEKVVTVATLGLIVVLLLLIFRSPVAALLPLVTVGLVFTVSTALVAAAATLLHFEVGQELPTMLTVVLFGIGTDYILFLLFRVRERLRAGDGPREAVVTAVEKVGEAIFSAAFAVIAAFSALVLAALGFFTTLGPALAIGVAVMLLAALTLVPAIAVLLGRSLFWPVRPRPAAGGPGTVRGGRTFAAVGRLVARRPAVVTIASLALLGGLAVGTSVFTPDYDPIGQLPGSVESTRAFADLKRGFPAGALQPTEVYLTSERPITQAEVAEFVRQLSNVEGVATPMAPRISSDARTVAVPLMLTADPFSSAAMDLVAGPLRDAARQAGAEVASTAQVLVGGQSMAFADVRDTTQRDLAVVFPVAGVLFVLILAGLLRSVLAPLYLVALVVLGFAATLGAAALVFQGALGHAGLAFTIPIILYLFVTAIGTDYNILVTARLREELRDGRPARAAAAEAIAHAGPAVAAAAVILAGTFASLLISGVPFLVEIGFAVTLGILLVAFVVSLLLVPAVTILLARFSRSIMKFRTRNAGDLEPQFMIIGESGGGTRPPRR